MFNDVPRDTGTNNKTQQSQYTLVNSGPTDKMSLWLQSYGIQHNPFDDQLLDAGSDPHLSTYLVGHHAFEILHRDQNTFVFAPIGGGKSAFRVRLARACRVREDGRALFPITYALPTPEFSDKIDHSLCSHLKRINMAIAEELLLTLIYRPGRYLNLTSSEQCQVRAFLHQVLAQQLTFYLKQLASEPDVRMLIKKFDPSAEHLFSLPDRPTLQVLCQQLTDTSDISISEDADINPRSCFDGARKMLHEILGYEAIYLLIDGIDAYIETVDEASRALTQLRPLLRKMSGWASQDFYTKYFLPIELASEIRLEDLHRTNEIIDLSSVRIQWSDELLREMLQARILAASEDRYDSLAAISASELKDVDSRLIKMAREPLPREVLVLANRVLWEHVQRVTEPNVIELTDLQNTQKWYEGENLS